MIRAWSDLLVRRPLPRGEGSGTARLVYWFLLSCSRTGATWPSNHTISLRTGLGRREVERALRALADAGVIRIEHCERHDLRTHRGRSIHLPADAPKRIDFPSMGHVGALWALARNVRGQDSRPAALVTLAVGAWLVASRAHGGPLEIDTRLGLSLRQLRELTGASRGMAFDDRLRELELIRAFERAGEQWRHGVVVRADLTDALRSRGLDEVTIAAGQLRSQLDWMTERWRTPVVWPSGQWLADRLGTPVATVRAALARLEETGQIAVRRRRVADRWRREILVLSCDPEAEAEAKRWRSSRWDDPEFACWAFQQADEHAERERAANDSRCWSVA